MVIFLGPLFLLLLVVYLKFIIKIIRSKQIDCWVPQTNISISVDNGETYTNNLKNMPSRKLYLKIETSVSAKCFWGKIYNGEIIKYRIMSQCVFDARKSDQNCLNCAYQYTNADIQYFISDSDMECSKKCKNIDDGKIIFESNFIISKKPRRNEIIIKIDLVDKIDRCKFVIEFDLPVNSVYKKTFTLFFVDPDNSKKEENSSDKKVILISW
jgi:hypothetical protein